MIHSAAAPNTAGGATGESFPNILAGCIPQARWSNRFTNQPPESSPRPVSQLEELLKDCKFLDLIERPGLWQTGLPGVVLSGKPPDLRKSVSLDKLFV